MGIGVRSVRSQSIKTCNWIPHPGNVLKIYCDGAARRNPGQAGAGVVIRDHNAAVIETIAIGLGSCSNFVAEVVAIYWGLNGLQIIK
ncbi:Ribonuclease H domain [Macleaya cordata]|uniref:Ribonuclease H domain n=1 Tax=Macleaya cordata TaxID=56857 RepID=A0A200QN15_MACCD|nr:Ribonuclease H domain [Macleaya cordata]